MLRGKYQASLEFLTTYGWAIAVVILVLAILFSTGIFSFSSSVPNSISGFSSTPVSSVAANPTALEMDVGNNVGQPINITGIVVNSSGHSYSSFSCQNNYIYPGQSTICYVSGSFSNPAYISAEIIYYIATNRKIYLSSTGSIVVSLSKVLVPAGVKYYVPITIKNTQTSPTPNPFQQMINVSSSSTPWVYINTSQSSYFGQNVEFFYSNGEAIPSWLEQYHSGYAIWWIKIGNIPSSSSITVYMGFASKTTNLFNTNDVGEAPQLSSTYGQYDDGANVFNFYDNFAGTSLNTNKWTVDSSGTTATYSVSNGLTLTATSTGSTANYMILHSSATFGENSIVEAYSSSIESPIGGVRSYSPGFSSSSSETGIFDQSNALNLAFSAGRNGYVTWMVGQGDSSAMSYYGTSMTTPSPGILGVYYTGSTNYFYEGYTQIFSSSTDTPTGSVYASLGIWAESSSSTFNTYTTWIRVRAYPPNGVMPSVTFGSVS